MAEKPAEIKTADTATATVAAAATVTPPRRPGHRGADVRDTVAEMAARAQEISLEAGSKIAAAMKDVIGAAAGLTGFALESARDLVQYMVRRGQMTQDEADKLIREVEDSQGGSRRPVVSPARPTQPRAEVIRPEPVRSEADGKRQAVAAVPATPKPVSRPAKPAAKAARSKPSPKPSAKRATRAKSAAGKKSSTKARKKR